VADSQTPEQKVWAELYERFDPEKPAFDRAWRVEREYSPAKEIASELARPMGGHKRFMILGGLGSGKSTELYGIAEERSREGPVVFVDLVRHFEERVGDAAALDRVQPWEVLLLIGLAVFRVGEGRLGHHWDKELLERFNAAGKAFEDEPEKGSFDAAQLASAVFVMAGGAVAGPLGAAAGAGLVAIGEAAKSVQWRFKIGIPGREARSDQDARVQRLLDVVNSLVGELQATYACRLTIFLDGLDRIKTRERIEMLFVESSLLGSIGCDIVLTGPMALHWGSLRKHVRKFTTKILTNAPVVDRSNPWSWTPGGARHRPPPGGGPATHGRPPRRPRPRALVAQTGVLLRRTHARARAARTRDLRARVGPQLAECRRGRGGASHRAHARGNRRRAESAPPRRASRPVDESRRASRRRRRWRDARRVPHPPLPNESTWYFPHPLLSRARLRPRREDRDPRSEATIGHRTLEREPPSPGYR
jgi:hypothetical protein